MQGFSITPNWFILFYRWGTGIRLGRTYFHLRKPVSPKLFTERHELKCWCGEVFFLRLTIRGKI